MKRFFLLLVFAASLLYADDTVSSVRRELDYQLRDSVDNTGNLYIRYMAQHPSVLTQVNGDASVTVCCADTAAKMTHIYEFSADLQERKTLSFRNELDKLGAFTKDSEGNYYFFYGTQTQDKNANNMAMVKYDKDGNKIKTFRLKANPPNSMDGIKSPFDAGTCRLELSGSMLAVYFARLMFSGHQASYGFVLDKDSFERIDKGAAINHNMGNNTQMPYASHSFNQFILPVDSGFVFADHGDAYPRSFTFAGFENGKDTRRLHAFKFPGAPGQNATYAEMGGLVKSSTGYIFTGTYAKDVNTVRNLFMLSMDKNLSSCTAPLFLSDYTKEEGHAGHPKIVELGRESRRYLLMWEMFKFSTQAANVILSTPSGFLSTFMTVIDEQGNPLAEIKELKDIRLNMNDVPRYSNGKVYWTINDSPGSFTVYALKAE